MGFADDLANATTSEEPKYRPKVEFDGDTGTVTSGLLRDVPATSGEILALFGLGDEWVPHSEPRIKRMWKAPGCDDAGFVIDLDIRRKPALDWRAALSVEKAPTPTVTPTVGPWFTFQVGDIHIGKSEAAGGGTESIVARYRQSLEAALIEARRVDGLAGVHLAFVGDLIEGVVSQGGKNIALMDLTLTDQMRVAGILVRDTIVEFEKLGRPVVVSAIGGNHGDTQRFQGQPGADNHDIGIVKGIRDAFDFAGGYDDVSFVFPPPHQNYVTYPVGDTVFTSVHGHQFQSGSFRKKVEDWWSGMSLSGMPAGGSSVLMAGHFHTFSFMNIAQGKSAIFSPSMENMSRWFHDQTGGTSDRGACVYLTEAGVISRLSIV